VVSCEVNSSSSSSRSSSDIFVSPFYVIARRMLFPTKQSPHPQEIASRLTPLAMT
jgi:hypothetical protein